MPKINDNQKACLEIVAKAAPEPAGWMDFCKASKAGLCGACTKGLVARGLLSGNKDVGFSITPAGREALKTGKYVKP